MVVPEAAESMPLMAETSFEMVLDAERTRLMRFCAHLTGSPGMAEDLAQETLLEAWRNQHKLAEQDLAHPAKLVKWLLAIARNVCLRWERSHGHDLAHLARYTSSAAGEEETDLDESLAMRTAWILSWSAMNWHVCLIAPWLSCHR